MAFLKVFPSYSGAIAATTFEDGAVPLLSANTLRRLRRDGDEAIKKASWPAMILAVCNETWTEKYNTTQSEYLSLGEWWALADAASGDADDGTCTLDATRSSNDVALATPVAEALWSLTDDWSVVTWSSVQRCARSSRDTPSGTTRWSA